MKNDQGDEVTKPPIKKPDPTIHVSLEQAEKVRDAAYHQGRKDAVAEIQKARDSFWTTALINIDTVQARAELEASRRIAEELHILNEYLSSGKAAEAVADAFMNAPVPIPVKTEPT